MIVERSISICREIEGGGNKGQGGTNSRTTAASCSGLRVGRSVVLSLEEELDVWSSVCCDDASWDRFAVTSAVAGRGTPPAVMAERELGDRAARFVGDAHGW
jgi:hypothetical protein